MLETTDLDDSSIYELFVLGYIAYLLVTSLVGLRMSNT